MLNIEKLEEIAKRYGIEVSYAKKGKIIPDPTNFDGMFTSPTKDKINMLAIRKYCKENDIKLEDLTEEEIEYFRGGVK